MKRSLTDHDPAGMNELKEVLREICSKSEKYHISELSPDHFFLPIAPNNGQSCAVQLICDVLRDYRIFAFPELDEFLEFNLDGTMAQMKNNFQTIQSCAVYTNFSRELLLLRLPLWAVISTKQ